MAGGASKVKLPVLTPPRPGLCQKAATYHVVFMLSAAQLIPDVPLLLADPSVFLRAEDRDLIGFFLVQSDGNHAQHAACELSGKLGAQLLQSLLLQQQLLWANSLAFLPQGTAYPL